MRKKLRQREEPEVSFTVGFFKYAIPLLWHSENPQKKSEKIQMETNAHISSSSPLTLIFLSGYKKNFNSFLYSH